jgi:transposase
MKKEKKKRPKKFYSPEFKVQAIELAEEIGPKQAAEKLGIKSLQSIMSWIRYSKKRDEDADFRELEDTKAEIKKLRKQSIEDKKVIAILRDATAFFCQDQLK